TDKKTWSCVTDAPRRLKVGYKGQGFETLYSTSSGRAMGSAALDAWKKSTLHNSIILNKGSFTNIPWDEVGVGIAGPYAVLWFGYAGVTAREVTTSEKGL